MQAVSSLLPALEWSLSGWLSERAERQQSWPSVSENFIERSLRQQTDPKRSKWWLSWKGFEFLLDLVVARPPCRVFDRWKPQNFPIDRSAEIYLPNDSTLSTPHQSNNLAEKSQFTFPNAPEVLRRLETLLRNPDLPEILWPEYSELFTIH